jgi:DNA repair exonuclease SbcCD ATPase subunit
MSANSSAEYQRRWREANRERLREWGRAYYQKNKDKRRAQNKAERERNRERYAELNRRYREANREVLSKKQRVRRYKITVEEFDRMLADQNGCCAVCGDAFTSTKHCHIDHDHSTQAIRGILCRDCNHALGNVRDSVERLQKLIAYLVSRA